ncbi:MAG: hypothetical protein GVY19_01305 [Bacteroidetes bacterium]|jgi:hypothetical protein|nr:hypothetical protein [Bacteroidota bacterium]
MLKNHLLYVFSILIISGCAKTGTLSGGAKDETPPRHVESNPPLGSVNTDPGKIEITFDEFIQLQSIHQELIVSPPLEYRPEIELRNKTIDIKLLDTLQENTTYSFNFGNAIEDFREGNLLPNFIYVFSTGSYIDSMAVTGRVVNAFDLEPLPKEEKIKILLYKNLSDTAVLTQRPHYVGQADENGYFSVPYLQTGEYAIYALTDNNKSFMYDASGEKIAFLDSSFYLHPESFPKPDSSIIDSIAQTTADSLMKDTLRPDYDLEYALQVKMYIFEENRERQLLSQTKRDEKKYFQLIFKKPHPEEIKVRLLNHITDTNWFIEDINPTADTITYWITDSTIYNNDTLVTELSYYAQAESDTFSRLTDTISLFHFERSKKQRNKKEEPKAESKPVLTLNVGGKSNTRDINKPVPIINQTPIRYVQNDSILLRYAEDTLWFMQEFTIRENPDYLDRVELSSAWKPGYGYELMLLPGAVTDIYDVTNDTISYKFNIRKEEYYGQLNMTINGISEPTIIQMLKINTDIAYKTFFLNENTTLNLQYIHPGEYEFKAIYDRNENGQWDTGELKTNTQPEKVEYMPGSINVRSNWEIDQTWELKKK